MEEDWAIVKSQTSVTKRVFDTRLQYASLNDTHSDQLRNLLTKEFRWKYDSSIKDWKLCNFQNVNVSSFENMEQFERKPSWHTSAGTPKSSACKWVSRVGLWFSLWSPPPLLVHFWKKIQLGFPAGVQIISIYFDENLTHIQRALPSSKPSESVNVKLGALSK